MNQVAVTLVFEYVHMDLKTYILRLPRDFIFPQAAIQSYLHQIVSGIAFCHQRRIFHRNLCTQNILITRKGIIKVLEKIRITFLLFMNLFGKFYFEDHRFRFGAFIWNCSEIVHAYCDHFMVSIARNSFGHEQIYAENWYLVDWMHFCRNVCA